MSTFNSELSYYFNQISKCPVLSHEEQCELAKKAQKGNSAARQKLVSANLRFVVNIAKAYQNRGLELMDLVSEGNIGLMTAVDKFDASKGNHFITYAVWWIRQSILKSLYETGRSIRLPQHKANEVISLEKARKILEKTGESQDIAALGRILGMSEALVKELLLLSQEMASLESVSEGSDQEFGALIADNLYESPEESAIKSNLKDNIDEVLSQLKPMESKVIRLRYGLKDGKEKSLSEVGKICGLTKERIRQIESSAFARIRNPQRSKRLEGFAA